MTDSGSKQSVLTDTAVTLVVHAAFWGGPLVLLLFFTPPIEKHFKDFEMRVPEGTEFTLYLSGMARHYWIFIPIVFVPLFLLDAAFYHDLSHIPGRKLLRRLWSCLMIVIPILVMILFGLALYLPWIKLKEDLAR